MVLSQADNEIGSPHVKAMRGRTPSVSDATGLSNGLTNGEFHTEQIFSLLPDAVIIHRDAKIIFANPAARRMFGASSPDDLVGRPPIELVHDSDREQIWSRRYKDSRKGFERQRVETRFLRIDGSEFVGASKGVMIQWAGGPAMLLTIGDVTEQRRSESELKQSEAWYRRLFEVSPDAIYVHADDEIVFVNPAAIELFGAQSAEMLVGMNASDLYDPEDLELLARRREETQEPDGPAVLTQFHLVRLDGTAFVGECIGVAVEWDDCPAIMVIVRDLTERHRAEQALRESESCFRGLAQVSFDAIFLVENGIIIDVNSAASELYGYETSELIGLDAPMLATPDQRAACADRIMTARQGSFETEVARKDGSIISIEISVTSIMREGRKIQVVAMRDLSERLQMDAMRAAKDAADLASRLKSEFLANMSHELRTPLNAIIGFSEVMEKEMFGRLGSDRYIEYAGDIRDSASHLLEVINDILDITKIEAGKHDLKEDVIDPSAVIDKCVQLFRHRSGEGTVNISLQDVDGLPPLRADARKLMQILVNLLSNAIKFTPKGGAVTVAACSSPITGIEITVSDTGVGMTAADIPKALTPFQQVDGSLERRHEGTGLGLPIARSLIELHGGTLRVESEVGRGTRVTIRFPSERLVPEHATTH